MPFPLEMRSSPCNFTINPLKNHRILKKNNNGIFLREYLHISQNKKSNNESNGNGIFPYFLLNIDFILNIEQIGQNMIM